MFYASLNQARVSGRVYRPTSFHEKLASAKAEKEEEGKRRSIRRAAGAAGAALGVRLGGKALTMVGRAGASMGGDDPESVRRALKNMNAKSVSKGVYDLTAKDGRTIRVDMRDESNIRHMFKEKKGKKVPVKARGAMYVPYRKLMNPSLGSGGDIHLPKGASRNADVFFHELGHATGLGAQRRVTLGRGGSQVRPLQPKLLKGLTRGAGLMYAGRASNKQQADRANSVANAMLLESALTQAPTLVEEARASIRARGLAKKFGKGISRKMLLPAAYASYVGGAISASAPAIAAKLVAKQKQRRYANEKNAAKKRREVEKRDRLGEYALMANRGLTGMSIGSALGGAAAFSTLPNTKMRDTLPARNAGLLAGGFTLGLGGGLLYNHLRRKREGLD